MGLYFGAGIFGLMGCLALSPRPCIAEMFNDGNYNNNNNYSNKYNNNRNNKNNNEPKKNDTRLIL